MKTIYELLSLSGRRALVAGGSGHIGRAAVAALAELGAQVAVIDLQPVPPATGPALQFRCDLSDEQATRRAAGEAVAAMGGLEILVHTAALVGTTALRGWAEPWARQTVQAWDAAMRVNVTSAFVLAQELTTALSASGHGSIILLSSIYGTVGPVPSLYEGTPLQNPTGYGATKGAVLQLMRYLATLLAPSVRVNAISPGGVQRGHPPGFQERYRARTPLQRMATEEDLKGAVAYLAGDLSAYVTGHNLVVDGGWTAW